MGGRGGWHVIKEHVRQAWTTHQEGVPEAQEKDVPDLGCLLCAATSVDRSKVDRTWPGLKTVGNTKRCRVTVSASFEHRANVVYSTLVMSCRRVLLRVN